MIGMEANLFPRVSQRTIEIFGATLEEACLKKRRSFSADLHTPYFVKWREVF
jgi:hypothetical protein